MRHDQIFLIFGGRAQALEALGLKYSAPYRWTDPVSQAMSDRVLGCCYRLGKMRQYNKVMKCDYRGITQQSKLGDKIHCPLCSASLIVIERNGRAWIPAHERKEKLVTWGYQNCTKGSL